MHKEIFERLYDSFHDVLSGKCESAVFEAGEGFDSLSVEQHGDVFSIARTYEQNGDLMYDPMICLQVDYDNEKVLPISYENSGLGVYESYDQNAEPTPESVKKQNELLEFMDTWLDNIEEQGYIPADIDVKQEKEEFAL